MPFVRRSTPQPRPVPTPAAPAPASTGVVTTTSTCIPPAARPTGRRQPYTTTGTRTGRISSARNENLQTLPRATRTAPANPVRAVQSRQARPPQVTNEVATPIEDYRPDLTTEAAPQAAVDAVALARGREHADISPSGLKNVSICPAYRPEPREDQETGAADEGTRMHHAAETGVMDPNFDEEQTQCVQQCLDYTAPMLEQSGIEIHRELRLEMGHGLLELFGRPDLVIYNHKTHHVDIVDFKFGRIPVDDAEVNLQGKAYVLGAFEKFREAPTVTMHFLQPRLDEVSTHTFNRDDARVIALEISTILARARAPQPAEHIDYDNCTYCGRKVECLALRRIAAHTSDRYEQEFTDLPNLHSSEVSDPAELATMYKMAKIMQRWADSVKSHALQTYLGGTPIPGFQLKERAGTRKIEDGDNVIVSYNALVDNINGEPLLTHTDFIRACSISPAKLETAAAELAAERGETKAAAKRKISERLAELGVVSQGQPIYYMSAERE